MSNRYTRDRTPACSFCGKSASMVERLIAGPAGTYICNECVHLCQEIIADDEPRTNTKNAGKKLPKPEEIKKESQHSVVK